MYTWYSVIWLYHYLFLSILYYWMSESLWVCFTIINSVVKIIRFPEFWFSCLFSADSMSFLPFTVNMQGVYIKSLMWTTYRKANGIQSNIPRHCTTSFSSIIQGVVHFRIWASNANWWVKVSLLECLKYKHEKQPQKKINQDTLYGPAQTWSAKTLHIFWWSGSGKGGETMKTNKSWTCFSHAYDFHYAYRCGPFFCLDFLIVDLCLQQKEGTKVRGFPFLVAHCPQTFYRVTHLSMTTESPAVIGDWCA